MPLNIEPDRRISLMQSDQPAQPGMADDPRSVREAVGPLVDHAEHKEPVAIEDMRRRSAVAATDPSSLFPHIRPA